ncbi:phosphatidylglycerophosphatase A, partial [bacterium]|nr:phosphatidylglycerophosphatase A [bacterium]
PLSAAPPAQRAWLLLATWFGCGHAPVASGTFGTLGAIPLVWALAYVIPGWATIFIAAALFALGVRAAGVAEPYYGKSDAGQIVIDEVVGYMVTMYLIPTTPALLIVGFFVFRFFDIAKLWPASYFDRHHGPFAVMADDVVAGVYSAIVMHVIVAFGFFGA